MNKPRHDVRHTGPMSMSRRFDLGNNESAFTGIFPEADGMFLAMTFTQSKRFKTRAGAERWYARKTGKAPAHRSKGKHRVGRGRTAKEQALRNVEAASIRYMRAGKLQSSASGGRGADPHYERALQAAWKAGATGTDIQQAMARGEARAGRHRARGRHR